MSTENALYHALKSKGPATVKQLAKATKLDEDEVTAGLEDFKLRQWAETQPDEKHPDDPEKTTYTLTAFAETDLAQRYPAPN